MCLQPSHQQKPPAAYGKPIDRSRVTDIQEYGGKGVVARVDGHTVAAGNAKLMEMLHIPYVNCHMVGTWSMWPSTGHTMDTS